MVCSICTTTPEKQVRPICSTILLCILTGCSSLQDGGNDQATRVRKYDLELRHPGLPGEALWQRQLVMRLDDQDRILSYEMEVDSVFCLDTKCEVIPVRLYWDVLGHFSRYELPRGGILTKKDHVPFAREDYQKLDRILADRDSFLRDLKATQLVNPEKAIKTADGISAPTPVSMQSAVVAGAAYTCYNLWHWVNGDVSGIIRGSTAKQASNDQLLELYKSGNPELVEFAISQLITRKAYDPATLDVIAAEMPDREEHARQALRYLGNCAMESHSSVYHDIIEKVFAVSISAVRICILESLTASRLDPPEFFFDRISRFLPELETYYETHLLLDLESSHNPDSSVVTENALRMLQNDNFLIARRAFWFLEERELNAMQKPVLDAFRTRNRDRI